MNISQPLTKAFPVDSAPRGYPRVAAFQSSAPNFLQYRGFSYVHCRVLLELQYHIEHLEEELDDVDIYDSDNGTIRGLVSRRNDPVEVLPDPSGSPPARRSRPVILEDLRLKLMEYGMSFDVE